MSFNNAVPEGSAAAYHPTARDVKPLAELSTKATITQLFWVLICRVIHISKIQLLKQPLSVISDKMACPDNSFYRRVLVFYRPCFTSASSMQMFQMSQILGVFSSLHLEPWFHVRGRQWWKPLHFVSEKN